MKDKYEISLWEDYLVPASGNVPAHYKEKKICVIGSNTMTDSFRAHSPKLVSNINGTHTFEFKMYYTIKESEVSIETETFETKSLILDEEGRFILTEKDDGLKTEESSTQTFTVKKSKNPFLNLLVNERKIKVFWKDEWYDFVIKNCQEDSSGKCITYTCTDVFINELSKNGFSIVLDDELENNCGTVLELAETVLDGTDWKLDKDNSDIVQQKKEEPVYEVKTLINWTLTDQTAHQQATIPGSKKVLVYYQQIQNILNYLDEGHASKIDDIQVAYAKDYERDVNSQLVTNAHCYGDTVQWTKGQYNGVNCLIVTTIGEDPAVCLRIYYEDVVSVNYRAERLVKHEVSKLDTLTGKYCNVLIATEDGSGQWTGAFEEGDEIYEYQATEWNDAIIVNNLAVNPKDFINNSGWLGDENLTFQLYPPYTAAADISAYTAKSYLHFSSGVDFYNAGITQNASFAPDGFAIGETYIFRYKAMGNNSGSPSGAYITSGITPSICTYKDEGSTKVIDTDGDVYFDTPVRIGITDHWVEYRMTCIKSITRGEFSTKKIALFLTTKNNCECWLEEVQLFKEVYGASNTRINPEDIDVQSVASIKYVYFNHTKSQGLLRADDINPLWSSSTDWDCGAFLERQYNEQFEKVRSISAKQSNRFNLIQSIAETFECWAQFIINHDQTGKIIYNDDGTPQKYVRFKNEVGQNTGIGFIYGIDLRTISRTIQSDQIVTKTIVSQNNNEFAEKGFCTISRSKENYPRTNFILNFDYYINQGLIDGNVLNNDLYDSTGSIGYYYWLHKYNTEYDEITELLSAKQLELTKQSSYQVVYDSTITSLQESIANLRADLMRLAGEVPTWHDATQWIKNNADLTEVNSRMTALKTAEESLTTYQTMQTNLHSSISQLQTVIEEKEARQKELVELIEALDLKFYKKYSRFIQEGSWTSEDYIDDNLYYLDAQSVSYTSSRPQISYDISVFRISGIEEFKNKVFHLGDISFIQDPEFFGYVYINGIKTPYKEKVLISEVTSCFDSPEQDTFKVQNYKTQFEDLFQRITSTTQSLQYASGGYARAAAAIDPTGVINAETLQNSIALNEQLVYSAQNESVIVDSTGITVSDTKNPNEKTRITSGGLFISIDGGTTWKNAVRGEGIATQWLTSGSINTNLINIMDGQFSAFRWDETGINAYYKLPNNYGINESKFVRFDHFGIYGIDGDSGKYKPETEADIWEDAKFGMTWDGFFVKNKYSGYSVEVSSTNDIRIVTTPQSGEGVELIKIGALNSSNTVFGIRIKDADNNAVMETDNTGKLWLKDRLSISSTSGTNYSISIGYLTDVVKPLSNTHAVFNANNAFLVYEDGSIKATSGTIGGMTIDQVSQAFYTVECNKERIYKFYDDEESIIPTYSPEDIIFQVYDTHGALLTPKNVALQNPTGNYAQDFKVTAQDSEISGIVTLLKNLWGESLSESGTFVKLINVIYSVDTTNNTVTFNLPELFNYDVDFFTEGDPHYNDPNDIEKFYALTKLIEEENIDFKIIITGQDFSLEKTIPITFNVSGSTARFNLTATDIAMLVGDATLTFNDGGLEIRKGGFIIYNDEEIDPEQPDKDYRVFYYDLEEHKLFIKGNADFTGTIHATSGEFKGDVSADTLIANNGDIGGFIIKGNGLYSKEGATLVDNEYDVSGSKIKLLGDNGTGIIEAENINLGIGAHINKYLQLGEKAFIWNPDYKEPEEANSVQYVVQIKDNNDNDVVTLKDTGVLKLGNIILDGANSNIYSDPSVSAGSFSITPTLATFSNVTVSGKISTAVFEKGHIQSVGGLMLFKPSYKIESYSGNTVTLDQDYTGVIGNYVYIIDKDGGLYGNSIQVQTISGKTITLNNTLGYDGNLVSLIDIGKANDLIIGVNSSDTPTAFLKPRGITISEFNTEGGSVNPKVFLGDLSQSGIISDIDLKGFGLYSENVYLTGSLTTIVSGTNPTYAGVNTLDGVTSDKFDNDHSKIVFWAGAKDNSIQGIQSAFFQVTAGGSIYAARAKFTDSVIAESAIRGADIYAARIHGTGTDPYGLSFYDTVKGIVFFDGAYGNDSIAEVFSIGKGGLKKGTNYFIDVSSDNVEFNGDIFNGKNYYTDKTQSFYIHLNNNSIIGAHIDDETEVVDSKIYFDSTGINLEAQDKKINIDAPNVQINNTIYFGQQMMYEQLEKGYNLFVLTKEQQQNGV